MRNRILHLADLHLGAGVEPRLGELAPERREQLLQSREGLLSRLADWIEQPESGVGLVILAGDLFDHHAPPEEIAQRARTALARISSTVPIVTVPGNHDEYSYPDCIYRKGDWPGILVKDSEPELVWEGELESGHRLAVVAVTYVAGMARPGQTVSFPPAPDNSFAVAAMHGTEREYFTGPRLRGERCFRVSHRQVDEAGYRYLALGHIHSARTWAGQNCTAVYPNAPVGPTSADPGSGRIVCVEVGTEEGQVVEEENMELLGWKWQRQEIQVQAGDSPAQVADRVRLDPIERGVYLVRLAGHMDRDEFGTELEEKLRERGIVSLVDSSEAAVLGPPDLETLLRESTLAGEFARAWNEWKEQEQIAEQHALHVLLEGLSSFSKR